MTPEDKSKIEELKKSLYSRGAPDIRVKRRLHFSPQEIGDIKTDWEHPKEGNGEADEVISLNKRYEDHSMSFFTKLLIGSFLFFMSALGIGAYLVFNGSNIISANNIDITVNGPITVAGGDPISLEVQVSNKNNIKLETVDMVVNFPVGTIDSVDISKELKEYRELVGDISPGGVGQKTIKAIMYGEENSKKEIIINISYRVAGSNAIFKKQKTYEILISSSPLSLLLSSFKEVTSGQEFEFEVNLSSNSEEIIGNLVLKASYPFGFTFLSSDIKPSNGNTFWKIGDIPPKGKKTIKIKGRLEGQDDEIRAFTFTAGRGGTKNDDAIGTEYISARQEISIRKPFITTQISFEDDNNQGVYVGLFNNAIKAEISWFNNLPVSVIDGEVHIKLSGTAFDKVSVSPGDGYYKSADNEIVWNKMTTSGLGSIGAGENGSVSFSFIPRNLSSTLRPVTNPNILIEVNVQGKRISESNVPESIDSSVKRLIKISSELSLTSSIVRSIGPFENSGFVPPRAEKPTTYTVVWTINNTSNTVTGAEVRALLPPYVKWVGKTNPVGEDIAYNSNTGEVVWRAGNVSTYTTSNNSRVRQAIFQISFEPSVAQIGQVPILVQDTTLSGYDDFTEESLTSTADALTTRFNTDPAFKDRDDAVVP